MLEDSEHAHMGRSCRFTLEQFMSNHGSPVWGRGHPAHLSTVTRQVRHLLLCLLPICISAPINPPWNLPFSWVEKKKVVILFLIDYLESPWNGGNSLKSSFSSASEHRLYVGAKLTSISASWTHPVERALQAICFMCLGNTGAAAVWELNLRVWGEPR